MALPPPAYYDPAIDSQERASRRGLAQLLADIALERARGESDLGLARGDLTRERDEALADLLRDYQRQGTQFDWQRQDLDRGYNRSLFDLDRDYGRGMEDSQLSESRLREDYGTALEGLQRQYGLLAGRQAQLASAAGVGSGGVFAAAAQRRAENQAWDRRPIDTSFDRGLADLMTDRSRLTEDYGTTRGRLTEDYQTGVDRMGTQRSWLDQDYQQASQRARDAAERGLGQLNLAWDRQVQDWGRQEQRAQDEQRFFSRDADQARWWQARQAGYVAPRRRRGRV